MQAHLQLYQHRQESCLLGDKCCFLSVSECFVKIYSGLAAKEGQLFSQGHAGKLWQSWCRNPGCGLQVCGFTSRLSLLIAHCVALKQRVRVTYSEDPLIFLTMVCASAELDMTNCSPRQALKQPLLRKCAEERCNLGRRLDKNQAALLPSWGCCSQSS